MYNLRQKLAERRILVGLLALAIISIVGIQQLLAHRQSHDPITGTALAVHELLIVTPELKVNTSKDNPAKTTHKYLDQLQAVQSACGRVHGYAQVTTGLETDAVTKIEQTDELCTDLTKLSKHSQAVYTAIEPLLTSGTSIRRWQSLPLVASHTKHRHQAAINAAIANLKEQDDQKDFPSVVLSDLRQVKTAVDGSKGLAYLPALHNFQISALGERTEYWSIYADSVSLNRSLQNQFDGYCQSLGDHAPKQCATED